MDKGINENGTVKCFRLLCIPSYFFPVNKPKFISLYLLCVLGEVFKNFIGKGCFLLKTLILISSILEIFTNFHLLFYLNHFIALIDTKSPQKGNLIMQSNLCNQ